MKKKTKQFPFLLVFGMLSLFLIGGTCENEYTRLADEICDNKIDDDEDLKIDCMDSDCAGKCEINFTLDSSNVSIDTESYTVHAIAVGISKIKLSRDGQIQDITSPDEQLTFTLNNLKLGITTITLTATTITGTELKRTLTITRKASSTQPSIPLGDSLTRI